MKILSLALARILKRMTLAGYAWVRVQTLQVTQFLDGDKFHRFLEAKQDICMGENLSS